VSARDFDFYLPHEKKVQRSLWERLRRRLLIRLFKIVHRTQRRLGVSQTFVLDGKEYQYFFDNYNRSYRNERAVEVPVIMDWVRAYAGKRILEVGNVLQHSFSFEHDILDKYEAGVDVINEDIVTFCPHEKYDLIICISTLEHVGWDEEPRDPSKIRKAVESLRRHLKPGGMMVITLPLGYNPQMDRMLDMGTLAFSKQAYMKRVSMGNKWSQVDWSKVRSAEYNTMLDTATGIVIAYEFLE